MHMLFRLIRTEQIKLKRAPVWLAFVIVPIIPAFLGTMNYLSNLGILQSEWYSLWTQHTLFSCYFFLPILLGIYCAYLMRLEHSEHNWNRLLSMPVRPWLIFLAKLLAASAMVLLSQVWIGVLYVLSGKMAGLTSPIPPELAVWLLCGTLGGIVMAAIQLFLSLWIKSFAVPVGIALAGGISSLAALAKGFGHVYPYSLMAFGMHSNAPQEMAGGDTLSFVVVCICYIALFVIAGGLFLSRRDVK